MKCATNGRPLEPLREPNMETSDQKESNSNMPPALHLTVLQTQAAVHELAKVVDGVNERTKDLQVATGINTKLHDDVRRLDETAIDLTNQINRLKHHCGFDEGAVTHVSGDQINLDASQGGVMHDVSLAQGPATASGRQQSRLSTLSVVVLTLLVGAVGILLGLWFGGVI